jgi:glycosyltransferase involved in cell wall biosynthesis
MDEVPVTAVIPLHNKEREIGRTLRSVLAQAALPAAVVVVDDGSTDGGAEVVRSMHDARIRLIQQPNAGVSVARNRGIAASPTDLVALIDADDEWKPDFLRRVYALHTAFPDAGLWGAGFTLIDSHSGPEVTMKFPGVPRDPAGGLVKDFLRSSLKAPIVCASSVLCRRSILDKVGGFPEGVRLGEDLDLWMRIALNYPVAYIADPLVLYHKGASNRAMDRERYAGRDTCVYRTLTRALAERNFTHTRRRSVKLMLGTHLLEIARSAMAVGDRQLARALIREVVGLGVWPMRCLRRWIRTYR